MSTNAIEKALWQAVMQPADAQRFRDDSDAYLNDFRIDDDERSLLDTWDVAGLASREVNELLLMMAFATINGHDRMGEYVMKINGMEGGPPPGH